MGEFFTSIYCVFEDFFGVTLGDYLYGIASPYQTTNMFIGIGISMLAISLVVAIIYYYVVDHPRLSTWWGWGIFMLINAVLNFIVGWQWVLKHYIDGNMKFIDKSTNLETNLPIDPSDIVCFGVSNMLLSIAAFLVFSYIIKWWSTNSHTAPF